MVGAMREGTGCFSLRAGNRPSGELKRFHVSGCCSEMTKMTWNGINTLQLIKVLLSMIIGLGITVVLQGLARNHGWLRRKIPCLLWTIKLLNLRVRFYGRGGPLAESSIGPDRSSWWLWHQV